MNETLTRAPDASVAHALFELHPLAALVVDAQGRVTDANPAAHWLAPQPTTLPQLADLLDAEQAAASACRRAVAEGAGWHGTLRIGPPGGVRRIADVQVVAAPPSERTRLCLVRPAPDDAPAPEPAIAQVADIAPVMLWTQDPDGRATWFSAPWRAFTGRRQGELCGDGWVADVHPEDTERCLAIHRASFEERHPFSLDYRLRRHDGQYRWVLVHAVPQHEADGRFAGYVGSAVDIHERKALEEQLAAHAQSLRLGDRRQNEFLAMLSHQLRSPLAPIANAASVLRTLEDGNATLVRLREIIERQVGRLRRLVDDLVDVTRVMQGQITLVKGRVGVQDLLRAASEASQAKLDAAGHTLRVDAPAAAAWVIGDPVRLAQAIGNILGNAATFTTEPSVISLRARTVGDTLEIAVRDEGQGITAEFLPFVFDLFARQDLQSGHNTSGLGLGLPLARRIAQLHGGDVKAFSEGPGKGAEFVVSLPLAHDKDGRAPSEDTPVAPGHRVLLIEENPDSRYLMRLQVELWGHQVATAGTVDESLRLLDAFRPEVVLYDIEDTEAASPDRFARLRNALGADVLFVALTGFGHRGGESAARALGFDRVLVKPLRPDQLLQALRPRQAQADPRSP